jgi:hypothetical protein
VTALSAADRILCISAANQYPTPDRVRGTPGIKPRLKTRSFNAGAAASNWCVRHTCPGPQRMTVHNRSLRTQRSPSSSRWDGRRAQGVSAEVHHCIGRSAWRAAAGRVCAIDLRSDRNVGRRGGNSGKHQRLRSKASGCQILLGWVGEAGSLPDLMQTRYDAVRKCWMIDRDGNSSDRG